jgi:hypothetical protein
VTTALAVLAAAALQAAVPPATERTFERTKDSLVTVEVHSGNRDAKNALGSGYLVAAPGVIITNYHVVGSFVSHPTRYQIRVKTPLRECAAKLVQFDIANDLAVLNAPCVDAPPLKLASVVPPAGSGIVAFGNPQGLGMSLIEGIVNGFAEKGVVERMLLSMPLNSGMSGGPILDRDGAVIGTNVSVMYLSNSLSFGVPVSKAVALLARPPLPSEEGALREEVTRQLDAVEAATTARVVDVITDAGQAQTVTVGGTVGRRPPDLFECWDDVDVFKDQGITKTRYGCDLQFTPSIDEIGPVGAVEVLYEHFAATGNRYGFYDHLSDHGAAHLEVAARDPNNGVLSAPECVSDRVAAGAITWKVNTCVSALVQHPGFFQFDLVATSVNLPRQAVYFALHMKGARPAPFARLAAMLLRETKARTSP